jgi:hypothetical protein
MSEDKLENARRQGQAQFDSILEMVEALRAAEDSDHSGKAHDDAIRAIEEDALSVEVRSDWVAPGSWDAAHARDRAKPAEYCILLCTGGPAVRIVGRLDDYCQPESAELQVQDWFTPWTEIRPTAPDGTDAESVMLEYVRVFWFGD